MKVGSKWKAKALHSMGITQDFAWAVAHSYCLPQVLQTSFYSVSCRFLFSTSLTLQKCFFMKSCVVHKVKIRDLKYLPLLKMGDCNGLVENYVKKEKERTNLKWQGVSHVVHILTRCIPVSREISDVLFANALCKPLAYMCVSCGMYIIALFSLGVCWYAEDHLWRKVAKKKH